MKTEIPQEELHRFWKNVVSYVVKKTHKSPQFSFENASDNPTGKIISNDPNTIKVTKEIFEELKLPFQKNGKKHGTGNNFTILIKLAVLTSVDIERIKNIINPSATFAEKAKHEKIETAPLPNKRKYLLSSPELRSLRISISRMISSVFAFEKEAIKFEYVKTEKDDAKGIQTIKAEDVASADKINAILRWMFGSEKVTQECETILVDCSNFLKNTDRIIFCFPPTPSSSIDEIIKRLERISFGSKPIVDSLENGNFKIHYIRKALMLEKMLNALEKMEWPVKLTGDKNFIELELKPKALEPEVIISETNPAIKFEESIPLNSNLTEGFTEEENEIRQMLQNPETSSVLSAKIKKIAIEYLEKRTLEILRAQIIEERMISLLEKVGAIK